MTQEILATSSCPCPLVPTVISHIFLLIQTCGQGETERARCGIVAALGFRGLRRSHRIVQVHVVAEGQLRPPPVDPRLQRLLGGQRDAQGAQVLASISTYPT